MWTFDGKKYVYYFKIFPLLKKTVESEGMEKQRYNQTYSKIFVLIHSNAEV